MPDLVRRRWPPFAVIAALLAIVCVAVARLPESFINQLERNRPFTSSQAGWAYRLLAAAAVAQALYGGFLVLRAERIEKARAADPKVARMSRSALVRSLARNAAAMVFWTIAYGIAAFAVTGQRGGFWFFPLLALFQGAWYYRQTGEVARWVGFQPEPEPDRGSGPVWRREPPDYTPPLLRGLTLSPREDAPTTPG